MGADLPHCFSLTTFLQWLYTPHRKGGRDRYCAS